MKISSYGSNFKMPECRTVRHPVSRYRNEKKLTVPEPVQYRTKLMQSGIFLFQYRTEIMDAGIPMPALVSSMPMPSFVLNYVFAFQLARIGMYCRSVASSTSLAP
jgi:hypothetical protein